MPYSTGIRESGISLGWHTTRMIAKLLNEYSRKVRKYLQSIDWRLFYIKCGVVETKIERLSPE